MRIDIHTHIFPPEIVQDRHRFFDGEPAFQALYDSPRAKLATAESLLEAMTRDGVDRAVAFAFPWQKSNQGDVNVSFLERTTHPDNLTPSSLWRYNSWYLRFALSGGTVRKGFP